VTADFVSCDINHDGVVNIEDIQLITNGALGSAPPVNDMNNDGVVNVADIQMLLASLLGSGEIWNAVELPVDAGARTSFGLHTGGYAEW